jgi:polyphosphate kinase
MVKNKQQFINREISWLYFNDRVLQEAADPSVPLVERARFLGIFSNNLDEFFRVRVATHKRMALLGKKALTILHEDPAVVLKEVQHLVIALQKKFERIYRQMIKEFEAENIYLINERQLDEYQSDFVRNYFEERVRPNLVPIMLNKKTDFPALKDKAVYLAIKLFNSVEDDQFEYALVEIPKASQVPRFLQLPDSDGKKYLMLVDDVIRHSLKDVFSIFQFQRAEAYTIKITRDAEIEISEDMSQSLTDKIEKGLKKRREGQAVRLVYDSSMPKDLYHFILKKNKLRQGDNLIAGGRYHNFKDFLDFPDIGGRHLVYDKKEPLPHKDLMNKVSMLEAMREKDIMLFYPFQKYSYIIDLLREAAIDPAVTSIKMTLYRAAKNSRVINALINAAKNGKSVTVVVELRARFDEEHNMSLSNKLLEEGVKVIFGVPGLKVHSKLLLIKRKEGKVINKYAHIGTGNFHEGTAKVYSDITILTSDERITNEIDKVFSFYKNNYKRQTYRQLFVSPFNTRRQFVSLIDNEIKNCKAGKSSGIIIKLNNLSDYEMIGKLYEASNAGVPVKLILRGICCLIPGVKGQSENIEVISIVDRFLEHARIFVFENDGNAKYYISSADWMKRNLDDRSEVTLPILDKSIQNELKDILNIQLADRVKARIVEKDGKNDYLKAEEGEAAIRSQLATYDYFAAKLKD